MTRPDGTETRYDLNAKQRQERRDECRQQGHDWHTLPGTGGVRVCYRCIEYLRPEDARRAAA